MYDKEKNGDGGSGSYQRNNWGDKKNNRDKNSAKSSELPDDVDSTGLNYAEVDWN